MNRLIAALALSLGYVAVLLSIYYVHARYFPVDVVFYSAILDAVIAAGIVGLGLFLAPSRWGLDWFSKVLLVLIWLMGGYAFAISVPTVIDRSLSMYILEKLDQRGGGIELDQFDRVFSDEYMGEYRLVDVRLTEQVQSGTIIIEDGCVKLTDWGRRVAAWTRFLRANFLAKKRLLDGEYTDALTDPLAGGNAEPMGYECN